MWFTCDLTPFGTTGLQPVVFLININLTSHLYFQIFQSPLIKAKNICVTLSQRLHIYLKYNRLFLVNVQQCSMKVYVYHSMNRQLLNRSCWIQKYSKEKVHYWIQCSHNLLNAILSRIFDILDNINKHNVGNMQAITLASKSMILQPIFRIDIL